MQFHVTSAEEQNYQCLVASAKERASPEAEQIRQRYIDSRAGELVKNNGLSIMSAKAVIESRIGCVLKLDDVLQFQSGDIVTVREACNQHVKYGGMACADPVEPEEGKSRAMFFGNNGDKPLVYSQLHGGRNYFVKGWFKIPPELPAISNTSLVSVNVEDFLEHKFPKRENIIHPWLPKQGLCMVHAYRGIGKTHFSIGIAVAAATGETFLKWHAPRRWNVVFIDGEMPGVVIQRRLKDAVHLIGGDFNSDINLQIITPDLQPMGMPDLASNEGQEKLSPYIKDADLIVMDNISTLCRSGEENKSDSWNGLQEWLLRLRSQGKSVLLVHHDGKGGQQRGTSKKEDILDTVIQLTRPSQYNPADGAKFEVHFKKSRAAFGDDVEPFEASLVLSDKGSTWAIKKLEDSVKEKVKKLLDEKYSQSDIAIELEISKGYVSKLVKRIKDDKTSRQKKDDISFLN